MNKSYIFALSNVLLYLISWSVLEITKVNGNTTTRS